MRAIQRSSRREELEAKLDAFEHDVRRKALGMLVREYGQGLPSEGTNINMHMHSFFSYNAQNHSPSRLAWEARQRGLYAAGLCDFDVLDGLEEFLEAGLLLGLRTVTHLETRVFLREYRDVEISSPGEPGVTYIMAASVPSIPPPQSSEALMLARFRSFAGDRNRALVERINSRLGEIAIDYEREVVPLSPAGVPTERHIVKAYHRKALEVFKHAPAVARFWSGILNLPFDETAELLANPCALEDAVRAKLVKKGGGLGYVQPCEASFPAAEDFIRWALACHALPMVAWLDGTSPAERDICALLDCLGAKGAMAVNIIPERNWNVRDPDQQRIKRQNLATVVSIAEKRGLPINIGTELNRSGLPFADDLDGEVLKQYKEPFLRGARIMVGHTILARYADFPYSGEKAAAAFAKIADRNSFFERVGGLSPLTKEEADRFCSLGPERTFSLLWSAARAAGWRGKGG